MLVLFEPAFVGRLTHASWNPSHDVIHTYNNAKPHRFHANSISSFDLQIQSIFRIYRFGQKKPCYIYRFIAHGTIEDKIYERQIAKLAISKRVIDEKQIDRHYKEDELKELYSIEKIDPTEEKPSVMLPKDQLFANQLQKYPDRIWKYHEHDELLSLSKEETLSKDENEAAWNTFQREARSEVSTKRLPNRKENQAKG